MNPITCYAAFTHHRDGEPTRTVNTCLSWTKADPVAVRAEFFNSTCGASVAWFLARDLLANGLVTPTGVGDVRVLPPVDGELRVVLDSPSGHASLTVDADTIAGFLTETFQVCPAGCEFAWTDIAAELTALLESETA